MSTPCVHDDWLSLIEISGPFLAVPVLKEAFPQGLEELDATKRKRLRQAYEEWREALELEDAQFPELHLAWIDEVLSRGLELDEDGKGDVLKRADWCAANLPASLPEHGVTVSPDLAVIDEQRANKTLLLIQTYAQDIDLDTTLKRDGWVATPADRMVQLCRSLGCRLGLVTNGERWMLVDAPVGAVTTFASWYARIWSQEPITLQAFVHLLGVRRFFVDESEQLASLFDRSLKFQDEVTDALGEQVRRAVEVLIQTLDKADQDRNRELLHDVTESELYEAALTVMMRLVFLLSAEERGLLLMGDACYESNYAVSTLRMQLRKESEEILERRWDAWSRLLAVFRAVFGGIEHENLRLPALGGSLFDPDRFPFLEGRAKGSNWRSDAAKPLPIDNRTVLLLLEAIQQFHGRTLSYRALDVEQIGYVYEGLLERTVKRTEEVTLELDATKSAKTPWVKLAELDSARLDGAARLAELLQERSGSSASRVRKDLAKPVDDTLTERLLTACQGDIKLRDRVKPYALLLRTDPWGYPLVYPAGAFIVTTGSDRRETGTHYTPKSLTEAIVAETLTPVAYVGPSEGTPREAWQLKSPAELLELKICDPAMGSGAFLVQACRWLSDRLVEAWSQVEATSKTVSVDGEVLEAGVAKEPLPRDSEARKVIARRLIAERCLYGVDLNPLAVELAKLSIWLVTLAKGRPFGFLDHNLRCGDSLLGIHRLDQLTQLSMNPTVQRQLRLFGQNIEQAVREAVELRIRLREMPIRDIRDVEAMAQLDADVRRKLEVPELIADAFIGEVFASGGNSSALESAVASLTVHAGQAIDGKREAIALMFRLAIDKLSTDLPFERAARTPFHWPLEFPEVFARVPLGFDALLGNPPFLGGRKLRGTLGGEYLTFLINSYGQNASGNADLCAFFFLRSYDLCSSSGACGFIATNTIAEGDTRRTGLEYLLNRGARIFHAEDDFPWPGTAAVTIALVNFTKSESQIKCRLGGNFVDHITASLRTAAIAERALPISGNSDLCFQGSVLAAKGFILNPIQADRLIADDPKNKDVVFSYFTGDEIFNSASIKPSRYVINFFDWDLERARHYPAAMEIVEREVRPIRMLVNRKAHRDYWWHYGDKRTALYSRLETLSRTIVQTHHTKYLCPQFVETGSVFSHSMVIFPTDENWLYGILNSIVHDAWARENSGSIGTGLRYTPTDCFYTFPLPDADKRENLSEIGGQLETERAHYRVARLCSVNEMMDSIHDQTEDSEAVMRLREVHVALDLAVANAYGWDDLDFNYGFHEVQYLSGIDNVRFTISETARVEVLRRLSELNQQLYEKEVAEGLCGSAASRSKTRVPRERRAASAYAAQPIFNFDEDTPITNRTTDPAVAILSFLETRIGWHTKADVIAVTCLTDGQWNAAIADLIDHGKVERQGERRGVRYRAITDNGET